MFLYERQLRANSSKFIGEGGSRKVQIEKSQRLTLKL